MNFVDRVKNILVTPRLEWPRIAAEPATPQSIYVGYVLILAAIGPLALFLRSGGTLFLFALLSYVMTLVVTYLIALIVDTLAPTFGGEKSFIQSLKLTAYSYTAAWIAGIFQIVPYVGGIIGLLAAIYAWYTFYLGVPVMKKVPQEKAVAYTIVVVICGILLGLLLGAVIAMMAGMGGGVAPGVMGFGR